MRLRSVLTRRSNLRISCSTPSRELSGAAKVSYQSLAKPTTRSRASSAAPMLTSVTRSTLALPWRAVAFAARAFAWAASPVSRLALVRARRAVVAFVDALWAVAGRLVPRVVVAFVDAFRPLAGRLVPRVVVRRVVERFFGAAAVLPLRALVVVLPLVVLFLVSAIVISLSLLSPA